MVGAETGGSQEFDSRPSQSGSFRISERLSLKKTKKNSDERGNLTSTFDLHTHIPGHMHPLFPHSTLMHAYITQAYTYTHMLSVSPPHTHPQNGEKILCFLVLTFSKIYTL